jgi:hypothetical protein
MTCRIRFHCLLTVLCDTCVQAVLPSLVVVRPLALTAEALQIILHVASAVAALWLQYTVNSQQQQYLYSSGQGGSSKGGRYHMPRYQLGAPLRGGAPDTSKRGTRA